MINNSVLVTQAQINAQLEQSLQGERAKKKSKRVIMGDPKAITSMGKTLSKVFFRAHSGVFARLRKAVTLNIKTSKDYDQKMGILEQEKEILDDELNQAVFFGEDLNQ